MTANRHPTLEVLRNGNLRVFVASRFFSATSMTLLRTTIAWHVFDITQSAFYLGIIGLVQFIPVLPLSLLGGAVADTYDRRRIVLVAQIAALACSTVLWLVTAQGNPSLGIVYGVVLVISVASAFENPARASLLPTLVSRDLFPAAVTLHSTFQNLAWVTGPVLTGFVIAAYSVSVAYALNLGFVIVSLALLALVRSRTNEGTAGRVSLHAIGEGITFVRRKPVILSSMVLDMFAVVFASATALLPVYADEILQVGPRGYGLLSAALETGTFLMAVILLILPPLQRPGRALLFAVGVYGAATILFGLSRSFPLSIAAFVLAGMADQVSMVTRSTIIQLSTPDALRGRVSSVNMIFINASNQLGVAESGFLAALTSATFSVVAGGVACLGVLATVVATAPSLARYRVDEESG